MKNKSDRREFFKNGSLAASALMSGSMFHWGGRYEEAISDNPKMSAPADLKITDIKCGYIRGGYHLYVKIFTNQGIYGVGEGADATPGTYHLVKMMGQRIIGKSPLNVHRLFEDIRKNGFFAGAQSGMYVAVLSAVESALWDLAGKALGLPVYQLLGGKFRDKIRVYMDTALYQTKLPKPSDFADAAQKAVDMGFNAIKFDIDQANDPNKYDVYNWTANPSELRRMYDQIAAARKQVGPDIDICVDMHGKYDAPTGEKVAKMMLEIGAVDIIMPDLQKAGGLGEGQRIANLSNLYYVPFAPHMVSSFLGAMAACHVCASVPNFLILEWQAYFHTDPMFKEIVIHKGEWLDKGFIPLSNEPGVGVDINIEAMRKYAVKGVPFFD